MIEFLRELSEFQALGFLLITAVGTLGSLWFQWQNSRRLRVAEHNIEKVKVATNSLMDQAREAAHAAGVEVGRLAAESTTKVAAEHAAAIIKKQAQTAALVLDLATDRAAAVVRQAAETAAETLARNTPPINPEI